MSEPTNNESLKINATLVRLTRGDITRETVDAIVNAANTSLLGGGGVDGAIHRAGGPQILEECRQIRNRQGGCKPGEAVITTAGNLSATHVVHTVGPVWRGGNSNEEETLADAYRNSLTVAAAAGDKTIAFPSISTGAYGYPLDLAAGVALRTVADYCRQHAGFTEIRFVLFDQLAYSAFQAKLAQL